jgi:phenylalanyl-tRNA synthetase beta chain
VRQQLAGFGLQEFINSDLIGQKLADLALEWIRPNASLLTALHAKTEEYSILRPSLLPGLLESAKRNLNYKTNSFGAFEIGRIHFLQNQKVIEEPMAGILITGKSLPPHWSQKMEEVDFFDLKGILANLFEAMGLAALNYTPSQHLSFHPSAQANIFSGNALIGSFGEAHPSLLEKCDIKQRIFYAEINLHLLRELQQGVTRMRPLAQFPSSERDWTISLPIQTHIERVFDAIRSNASLLLTKVELIDLYKPREESVKHATFRFTYRDPIKTISFEEVEAAHNQLMDNVSKLLAK